MNKEKARNVLRTCEKLLPLLQSEFSEADVKKTLATLKEIDAALRAIGMPGLPEASAVSELMSSGVGTPGFLQAGLKQALVRSIESLRRFVEEGVKPGVSEGRAGGTFRDLYVNNATEAFAKELDAIREEDGFDQRRLNVLIDCLEAGVSVFSIPEQQLALAGAGTLTKPPALELKAPKSAKAKQTAAQMEDEEEDGGSATTAKGTVKATKAAAAGGNGATAAGKKKSRRGSRGKASKKGGVASMDTD